MSGEATLELFHPSSGRAIRHIEKYELRRDIEVLGYSWIANIAPVDDAKALDTIAEDPFVEARVDGTTIFRGIIVDDELGHSRSGTYYNFTAQDRLGYFAGSCLPLDFSIEGLTIAESVRSACFAASLGAWNPTVIGTNDVNRTAVSTRRTRVQARMMEAVVTEEHAQRVVRMRPGAPLVEWRVLQDLRGEPRLVLDSSGVPILDPVMVDRDVMTSDGRTVLPHPGDVLGDWLRRMMKAHSLLCWEAASGELVMTRPNYGQTTPISLEVSKPRAEGRIASAKRIRRPGDQSTELWCVGRVGHDGEAHVAGRVEDAELPARGYRRLKINVENDLHQDQAQGAAARMLGQEQLKSWGYEAKMWGHAVDDRLPAPDVMCLVNDPRCRITSKPLYCTRATLTKGKRGEGTQTEMTLVRPNLFLPGE